MSNHTPGPWEVSRPHADMECRWITPVATDGNGWLGDRYLSVSGMMHDEDAFLIAAAPELLEALETLLAQSGYEHMDDVNLAYEAEQGNGAIPAIQQARAAVAKAKGA